MHLSQKPLPPRSKRPDVPRVLATQSPRLTRGRSAEAIPAPMRRPTGHPFWDSLLSGDVTEDGEGSVLLDAERRWPKTPKEAEEFFGDSKRGMSASYTEDVTVCAAIVHDKLKTVYDKIAREPQELPIGILYQIDRVQKIPRIGGRKQGPIPGVLYVTGSHLVFAGEDDSKDFLLYSQISSVERGALSVSGVQVTIKCKSFLILQFLVARDKESHELVSHLTELSQPLNIESVYAFSYVSELRDLRRSDGWDHVDVVMDYSRLGLPSERWVATDLNHDYSLCETYPTRLFVPATASKHVLIGSSKFRSKNRLPVLAYVYPQNKAVICRCAQPLAGFSARNVEDEELFEHIRQAGDPTLPLFVIDTRPKINAMANLAAGKGFEKESVYSGIKFHFFGIENIHVMRAALTKLTDVCSHAGNMTTFLQGLDSSNWLKHMRAILEAATFVAQSVYAGVSCVVHCSDGWDRTALTVSLASLLLDPFYRSIHGLQTLIERDWLSFGHKFSDRCGHVFATGEAGAKEVAPVFTQFLDAVWQLTRQFPAEFQFNERCLLTLQEHAHSCQFGTFLGNCQKDRIDLRLSERTYSLWGFMSLHFEEYTNVFYDPARSSGLLLPDLRPQSIRLWTSLYNRYDAVHPRESPTRQMEMGKEQVTFLQDHVDWLAARIASLRAALGKEPMVMADSGISGAEGTPTNTKAQSDSESGFEEPPSPTNGGDPVQNAPNAKRGMVKQLTAQLSITSLDFSSALECDAVSLRWKSARDVRECAAPECTVDLDLGRKKRYCWRCGNSFCSWCVSQKTVLPTLASQVKVPVCKACFASVNQRSPE